MTGVVPSAAAAAAAAALVLGSGGGGGGGSGDNASGSADSEEGVDPIADAVSIIEQACTLKGCIM